MAAEDARVPAGWFQDPTGPGLRYWDGRQWTEHRSTEHLQPAHPQPAGQAAKPVGPLDRFKLLPPSDRGALVLALAAIAGMVIGTFSPWAQAFLVTANGIDSDGAPVLPCAMIAAGILWLYLGKPTAGRASVAAILGVAGAAMAIVGLVRIENQSIAIIGLNVADPAWGVYVTIVSSLALALAAGFLALRGRRGV